MSEIEIRDDFVIEKVEELDSFAEVVAEKYTALKDIKSIEDGHRICKCFLIINLLIFFLVLKYTNVYMYVYVSAIKDKSPRQVNEHMKHRSVVLTTTSNRFLWNTRVKGNISL